MRIADVVSCHHFTDGDFEARETAELHIYQEDPDICLELETQRQDRGENIQAAVELTLERVEIATLERLREKLSDWLGSDDCEDTSWKTMPLSGEFRGTTASDEIQYLEFSVSADAIRIQGFNPAGEPVEGAVTIPPTERVNDGEADDFSYFRRIHSILEIFLAGHDEDSADILEVTDRLVHPETHLHPGVPEECLQRLDQGDYKGVIQKAGETLEEKLKDETSAEILETVDNPPNIVDQMFSNNVDRGVQWGYKPAEQDGIKYLYKGAFLALRNPTSHPRGDPERNRYLDDISRQDAIDSLCLFNFLMRRLDIYDDTLELDEAAWN